MESIQTEIFNFDSWISSNELDGLKSALIALEFNNLSAILSLSEPLIDFILSSHKSLNTLDFAEKNKLKLQLLNALKELKTLQTHHQNDNINNNNGISPTYSNSSKTTTPTTNGKLTQNEETLKREDTFLIITNEENRVLQSLKNKIKSVEKYQEKFNKIQKQYEIHQIERKNLYTKEMENIDNLINETFKKLHDALDKQHEILLNKSNTIKQNELNCDKNNKKGLLSNFGQEMKQCFNALQIQKDLLKNSITKYQNIMTNSTQC